MGPPLDKDSRIAFVLKGGPENGPFSASVARLLTEVLESNGLKVSAIYSCSGSNPTALLGCIGEYSKLCNTWANLTPKDIVGEIRKFNTVYRLLKRESVLTSYVLGELLSSNWDLDKIFSPEAIPIKFPAVDIYSTEYIIFSNKNPKHKEHFLKGVLGSMALIPFLQPQLVANPEESELIEKGKAVNDSLLLVDGGFKGNMLLEEAMRDGFDVIFLIDIHGLKPTGMRPGEKYYWPNLTRSSLHILSNSNDVRQFQLADRINEEIRIKNELKRLAKCLPPEYSPLLWSIIKRMNEGRLRLGDKNETRIIIVSNEEHATLFNFAKFKQEDILKLMNAAEGAVASTLKELGLA